MEGSPLDTTHRASRRRKVVTGVALMSVLALVLAACGDSSASSDTPTEKVDPAVIADAEAAVEAATATPTSIGMTTPLTATPTPGKTIGYLECVENTGCHLQGNEVRRAAEVVGWNVKTLTYKLADPGTFVSAMRQMLQYKPVAVSFSSIPKEVWANVIPEYKAAGVGIFPSASFFPAAGDPPLESPMIGFSPTAEDLKRAGRMLADWVIADSEGQGQVVLQSVPSLPPLATWQAGFTEELAAKCTACKLTSIEFATPDLGTPKADSMLVTEIRKNPQIKYVAASSGGFANSIPGSLAAAGLKDVKTIGIGPYRNQLTEDALATSGPAWVAVGSSFVGWWMVDAMLRFDQKMPVEDYDGLYPAQLITADNYDDLSEESKAGEYMPNFDYTSQFAALWKVG